MALTFVWAVLCVCGCGMGCGVTLTGVSRARGTAADSVYFLSLIKLIKRT